MRVVLLMAPLKKVYCLINVRWHKNRALLSVLLIFYKCHCAGNCGCSKLDLPVVLLNTCLWLSRVFCTSWRSKAGWA